MSLEFVLQLGALLVGLTTAYMAIDTRSRYTEVGLIEVKADIDQFRVRIRDIEAFQARLDERFINIMTLLTTINDRLERAESKNP